MAVDPRAATHLLSRISDVGQRLRTRLARAYKADTLFFAELITTASIDIDTTLYPGLVLAHTTVGQKQTIVITYWKSREHFERDSPALRAALTTAQVGVAGFVRDYHEHREAWTRRVPWYTLVITLIAVLGAIESGRLFVNRLVAAPDVQLTSQRTGDFNFFTNDLLDETVTVVSHVPVEQHVRVTVTDIFRENKALQILRVEPTGIRELRENETASMRLLARMGTPGEFDLRLEIGAKAGRFQPERFASITRPITVWQHLPQTGELRIARTSDASCFVQTSILVGDPAPAGLVLTIRLQHHPEINDLMTTIPGARSIGPKRRAGSGADQVSVATFQTPPVLAFRRLNFNVVLVGSPTTDWRRVIGDLHLYATPAPEGGERL